MKSLSIIITFVLLLVSVSANGCIFGLTSSNVHSGQQYFTENINTFEIMNDLLDSSMLMEPNKIIIVDISSLPDSISTNKQAFKSIVQSSEGSFILPHNQIDLIQYTSSKIVEHKSIESLEEFQELQNALQESINSSYLILFQMNVKTTYLFTSPLSTSNKNTLSSEGKYLTPEIFLGICVLFIIIVGVLIAYKMTDAVQTPTQWVEKPLIVGKVY